MYYKSSYFKFDANTKGFKALIESSSKRENRQKRKVKKDYKYVPDATAS